MSNKQASRDWPIILMPSEFYDDIYKPVDDDGFLLRVFEGNNSVLSAFTDMLSSKAQDISGHPVADQWGLAKEEDYIGFFLYPKDNSKMYRVNCNQPTISRYYKFSDNYGSDDNGNIIVDNVMFGLIVTLAVFDTYGNTDDKNIIAAYVDSAQHIHNSINEVADSFAMKPSLDLEAFDEAMIIMSKHYGVKYDSSDYY